MQNDETPQVQTGSADAGRGGDGGGLPSNSTIFLKGLATETKRETVSDVFAKFGSVKGVRHRTSRGFGFVEFATREEMLAAVSASAVQIDGAEVGIEECKTEMKKKKKKKKGNTRQPAGAERSQEQGGDKGPSEGLEKTNTDEKDKKKKKKRSGGRDNKKSSPQEVDIVSTGNVRDDAVARALAQHKMKPGFPAAIEAAAMALCIPPSEELEDRTTWAYITIDGDYSVDLDQAMFIRKQEAGDTSEQGYLVSYALADGAHFVPPNSALFDHALYKRGGSSFYLPGLCVPMLPRCLSEGSMSLNEAVVRRSLVFDIFLDADGNVVKTNTVRARIHNIAKLSYQGVQEYYDSLPDSNAKKTEEDAAKSKTCRSSEDPPVPNPTLHKITAESAGDVRETLANLKIVGNLRRALARERNVVEFKRRQQQVVLNAEGKAEIRKEKQLKVELYNEQISLLCNIEGARLLEEKVQTSSTPIHAIFRLQNAPTEESVTAVQALIASIVRAHKLDAEAWEWGKRVGETLAAYLRRIYALSSGSPRLKCVFLAVQRAAMISNKPALFTQFSGQHWSIKAPQYARFSSPMREIAGCFTHAELAQSLGWCKPTGTDAIRDKVITAANDAKRKQRDLGKHVILALIDQVWADELALPKGKRRVHAGAIVGVDKGRNAKAYVMLHEPPLEVKVYLEDLGGYTVSADSVCLNPPSDQDRAKGEHVPSKKARDKQEAREHQGPQRQASGMPEPPLAHPPAPAASEAGPGPANLNEKPAAPVRQLPTFRLGDRVGLRLSTVEQAKGRKKFKFSMWLPKDGHQDRRHSQCQFDVLFDDV